MANLEIDPAFWRGRRVFITGHSGFKGGWMVALLSRLGAKVVGYSLGRPSSPCLFDVAGLSESCTSVWGDVRDAAALSAAATDAAPDVAFHLAAQPFVRRSYADPVETFTTNLTGTVNFLESMRSIPSLRAAIVITTDKCYANRESETGYRESDPLGGHDPYSASKACAELATDAYRRSYFDAKGVGLASARAGNVIGGGDWGEDRIVPDFFRAMAAGRSLKIRNPESTRPWQHVLDPVRGYLMLAERLVSAPAEFSRAWNFGPDASDQRTVRELVDGLIAAWGAGTWEKDGGEHPHETKMLKLDSTQARERLGWRPRFDVARSIRAIADWHRAHASGASVADVMARQMSL